MNILWLPIIQREGCLFIQLNSTTGAKFRNSQCTLYIGHGHKLKSETPNHTILYCPFAQTTGVHNMTYNKAFNMTKKKNGLNLHCTFSVHYIKLRSLFCFEMMNGSDSIELALI